MAPSVAVGMRRASAELRSHLRSPREKADGADDSKEGEYIDFEEVKD